MASVRKRCLPSGKVTWLVDFKDANGRRRARQFTLKRDAQAFLTKAQADLVAGAYVHDSESIRVADAIAQWLEHCAVRCEAGRRMERATLRDYEAKLRMCWTPTLGLARSS